MLEKQPSAKYSKYILFGFLLFVIGLQLTFERISEINQQGNFAFASFYLIVIILVRTLFNYKYKKGKSDILRFHGGKGAEDNKPALWAGIGLFALTLAYALMNSVWNLNIVSFLILAVSLMLFSYYYVPPFWMKIKDGKLSISSSENAFRIEFVKSVVIQKEKIGFSDDGQNFYWVHNIFFNEKNATAIRNFLNGHQLTKNISVKIEI
jgi:hypothetical protein